MSFQLLGRAIACDQPPLAVCELGINHGGSVKTAFEMVDAALDAGAEIINFKRTSLVLKCRVKRVLLRLNIVKNLFSK